MIPKTVNKIGFVKLYGKPEILILNSVENMFPLVGEIYKFPLGG